MQLLATFSIRQSCSPSKTAGLHCDPELAASYAHPGPQAGIYPSVKPACLRTSTNLASLSNGTSGMGFWK